MRPNTLPDHHRSHHRKVGMITRACGTDSNSGIAGVCHRQVSGRIAGNNLRWILKHGSSICQLSVRTPCQSAGKADGTEQAFSQPVRSSNQTAYRKVLFTPNARSGPRINVEAPGASVDNRIDTDPGGVGPVTVVLDGCHDGFVRNHRILIRRGHFQVSGYEITGNRQIDMREQGRSWSQL